MGEEETRILFKNLFTNNFFKIWHLNVIRIGIKYFFKPNKITIKIKKYKTLPIQVLRKSYFLRKNLFWYFLEIVVSLIDKSTSVFFFNSKLSSNLNSIDLINGYLGRIFSILFSIEIIVCSGIFVKRDKSSREIFFLILACFTNFPISRY